MVESGGVKEIELFVYSVISMRDRVAIIVPRCSIETMSQSGGIR